MRMVYFIILFYFNKKFMDIMLDNTNFAHNY
jgi:hypothetical protein